MRERTAYYINPLDFEGDVGIGLTLPLTNDPAALSKYSVEDSGMLKATAVGEGYNSVVQYPPTSTDVGPKKQNQLPTHPSVKVQGGFHVSFTTTEQAKSNLKNLVLTNRGERIMHPEFGCDVWKAVMQNNTKALREELTKRINQQASMWLPYINIRNVIITQSELNENRMNIKIDFGLYDNETLDPEVIVISIGDM